MKKDDTKRINENSVVVKHSAIIHVSNEFTKLQRIAFNVMLFIAYDDLMKENAHEIKVSDLREYLGIQESDENFNANNYIKNMVHGLTHKGVTIDILGKAKEYIEQSKMQQAGIEIKEGDKISLSLFQVVHTNKKGVIRYVFNPFLADLLYNPAIYAKIKLSMQQKFLNKYAVALYEICVDYIKIRQTPEIQLSDLKRLLIGGETKKTYKKFKFLNSKVLKPAIENINKDTDIFINPLFIKEGRTVVAVKFLISQNDAFIKPGEAPEAAGKTAEYGVNKEKVLYLANEILAFTQHQQSRAFYFKIVWKLVVAKKEQLVTRVIAEIKADFAGKKIKNKAALFNQMIQDLAREHKIDLGLQTHKRPLPSPALPQKADINLEATISKEVVLQQLEALRTKKELFSFPQ